MTDTPQKMSAREAMAYTKVRYKETLKYLAHIEELEAAVAATYEDCWEQSKEAGRFAPDIPADAQAALEDVKREARNEALREAEAAISKLRMQNQDIVSQWNGAIDQASDVILALMEGQSDE